MNNVITSENKRTAKEIAFDLNRCNMVVDKNIAFEARKDFEENESKQAMEKETSE